MFALKFRRFILAIIFLLTIIPPVKAVSIDSLIQVVIASSDDTHKVHLYLDVSDAYIDSNYAKARSYSQHALDLSRKLNFERGRIHSLISLNNANDYMGRYKECQEINFELLEYYKKKKDRDGEYNTYNHIGIVHY